MSQQQINDLKSFLEAQGFIEGEHFNTHIEQGEHSVSISVEIELDPPKPLPEELIPFEHEDLDRYLWKGNYKGDFKTWAGINYEVALDRYAGSIMDKDPEWIELCRRISSPDKSEMPTIDEYKSKKAEIEKRICADPQIAAWEQDLKDNYL